jgi:hypothetical protein
MSHSNNHKTKGPSWMNTPYPVPLKIFATRIIPLTLTALAAASLPAQVAGAICDKDTRSGQILGLNAFELQGVSYKQDWLRSGLGVEGQVGPGTATIMLNASHEGDNPSTWGFASYRLPF